MLTHGLGVPEGRRPHARHRHRHYTSVGAMRVTRGGNPVAPVTENRHIAALKNIRTRKSEDTDQR
jgi:hypothetical protein